MNILGIESTCDETGISVVKDGREVLLNLLASSVDLQQKYGGVVPEIAAREQTRAFFYLLNELLGKCSQNDIDAVAVSYGPGLIGSLVVGVESAKALAYSWQKPLIGVNHLVGHFFANWIGRENEIEFPAISLIVSGGHTDLLLFESDNKFRLLGSTLDDAAGEAFDKVAKFLELGYPGGPEVEKIAKRFAVGNNQNPFPTPLKNSNDFNFSFSGLKTSVVNFALNNPQKTKDFISYFFQESAIDVLVFKTLKAAKNFGAKSVVVGGGVAANARLREVFSDSGDTVKVFFPEKKFSVDNGAMIATAAYFQKSFVDPLKLTADSSLHF